MSEKTTLRHLHGKYIRATEYVAPRDRSYVEERWTTTRELPSGRMRIVAYSPYRQVDGQTRWDETKSAPLHGQIKTIVEAIEAMASVLVAKLEQADREAETRRQQRLAEEENSQRAEDRKRVEQSIAESKVALRQVIERWSDITNIESFFVGVERRANDLSETDRRLVLERLTLARECLGNQDPLDLLRGWKTPEERYTPRYPHDTHDGRETG